LADALAELGLLPLLREASARRALIALRQHALRDGGLRVVVLATGTAGTRWQALALKLS